MFGAGEVKYPVKIFYPPTTLFEETTYLTNNDESSFEIDIIITPDSISTFDPIIEVIKELDITEDINEKDLDKLLNETFESMSNYSNINKVIVINSSKMPFNSNLSNDQFIKPKEGSEIDYIGGNLNLILPNSGDITVTIRNEEVNLSLNGEGDIKIKQENQQSGSIYLSSNSFINGSMKITVPNQVDSIMINSIDLQNNGSISVQSENNMQKINISINDITANKNSNGTISNANILNSINVVQTATLNFDNVHLENSVINIEIFDFEKENNNWYPFLKGNFNIPPKKIYLKKTNANDNTKPFKNQEYTLISGLFEENMCESWLNYLEYGNSGFNSKFCEDNPLLSHENKQIVIKMNSENNKSKLNGGQIAGIVIGCIAGVAIIVVSIFCIIRMKNKRDQSESQDENIHPNEL